jgi:uncharacterized membrane protein HdeD (DUF308 family)
MTDLPEAGNQDSQIKRPAELQGFAKLWWLNIVRGVAALAIGFGLLLPVELIMQADQVQGILFQFIGIYLLVSGIMSLSWGLSNRRRLGIWLLAGALGLLGGIAFLLRPVLEDHFSETILTIIFGLIMLLAGLIHFLGGFRLSQAHGRRWSLGHEFLGLVEIAISILIFISIFVTVDNLRILLSFWGLIAGVGLILDGLRIRRLSKALEASPKGESL